ncbi:GPP34 family phosphoprotein [Candidatus Poriferisodalis sp.]|uniref:GPP34 family phosphoprotein n=1 Tax=Candidatus Poriferisodalis sp. TaxID=3101277 RepID=UPI003C6F66A9
MLRFAEEILLLRLRDDDGKLIHVPERTLDRVIAGSVLMDLAMENRIDTDLEKLMLSLPRLRPSRPRATRATG